MAQPVYLPVSIAQIMQLFLVVHYELRVAFLLVNGSC